MAADHKLTAEEQQQLRSLSDQIAPIRRTIEALKRIGTIDVSEQEQRLATLVQTREGLLREFGSPITSR